eukprot:4013713-Prymnesium_polylepis.2
MSSSSGWMPTCRRTAVSRACTRFELTTACTRLPTMRTKAVGPSWLTTPFIISPLHCTAPSPRRTTSKSPHVGLMAHVPPAQLAAETAADARSMRQCGGRRVVQYCDDTGSCGSQKRIEHADGVACATSARIVLRVCDDHRPTACTIRQQLLHSQRHSFVRLEQLVGPWWLCGGHSMGESLRRGLDLFPVDAVAAQCRAARRAVGGGKSRREVGAQHTPSCTLSTTARQRPRAGSASWYCAVSGIR